MILLKIVKSLFSKEKTASKVSNEDSNEDETPQNFLKGDDMLDESLKQSFLIGEAEYRNQPIAIKRYEYGEPIRLGLVLDTLMGENVSHHLTGMALDSSNITFERIDLPAYISSPDEILKLNIIDWLIEKNKDGEPCLRTGNNVVLTITRDNGLPVVLHIRNILSIPYLVYSKVTAMVSGTSDKDDMRSFRQNDMPQFRSTLLSFRRNNDDISVLFPFYNSIEKEANELIQDKDSSLNELHIAFLRGRFGLRTADYYLGYGSWLLDEKRPYDALRQFMRLMNIIDNPQQNLNNGTVFGTINHSIAQCLVQTEDQERAFHYMEVANFFDGTLRIDWLRLLSSLCDFRLPQIINREADKYESNTVRGIWAGYALSKYKYKEMIEAECPYVSMGFVLSQLLRIHPYNIFGMRVYHHKDGTYTREEIKELDTVWKYRLSDALADGNTIVISYSQAYNQCKQENDHSMLCPDNVIILHVTAIPGQSMFRIDMMVPPFVFDTDRVNPKDGDMPIHSSFVMPSEDYTYDFSLSADKLLECAHELYNDKRCVEALLGYHYVYISLLPKMGSIPQEEKGNCVVAASHMGSCFLELNMNDVAEYYLKIGTDCNYQVGEYINCLVNNKDVRSLAVIQNYLLSDDVIFGPTIEASRAFLHRRMAYVLIDWGMIDKAKQLLENMLNDPLCHDFAQHELEYLQGKGK